MKNETDGWMDVEIKAKEKSPLGNPTTITTFMSVFMGVSVQTNDFKHTRFSAHSGVIRNGNGEPSQ